MNVTWFKLQIQNEGYLLQLGVKDALLNALLLAVKRFSTGPPQVHCFSFLLFFLHIIFSGRCCIEMQLSSFVLKIIWFQLVLCYYRDSFWHRSVLHSLHLYFKLLHMETQLSSCFTVYRICKVKMMAILLSLRCSLCCRRKLLTTSVSTQKLVHYTKATIPKRFWNFCFDTFIYDMFFGVRPLSFTLTSALFYVCFTASLPYTYGSWVLAAAVWNKFWWFCATTRKE